MLNGKINTFLISVLISYFPHFHVYAESKPSAKFDQCMENVDLGALKNSQWASCAADEIKRQDVILNSEYKKLKNSLSPEQRESLTKAQKSWLKFREDWCRFEELSPSAPGGDANYNQCIMELTNKQNDAIIGFQN